MAQRKAARPKLDPVAVNKTDDGNIGHDTGEAAQQLSSKIAEVGLAGRKGAGAIQGTDNVPALQGVIAEIQEFAEKDATIAFDATVARASNLLNFINAFYETDEERFAKSCRLYMTHLRESLRKKYNVPTEWLTKEGRALLTNNQKKVLQNIAQQASLSNTVLEAARRNHTEMRNILASSRTWTAKIEQARQLIPQRQGPGRPKKTDSAKAGDLIKSLVENVSKLSDDQLLVFMSEIVPTLADRPMFEKQAKYLNGQMLILRKQSQEADKALEQFGNGKTGTHG